MENSWKETDNTLQKRFEFENFIKALEFVNKCAKIFEEENHHPDISIVN